jgi:vacuolar-type H+-ATPase subunit E/Vma4
MPLDHLLAALERDGGAQAEALLTQARAMAAAITREADELVARRRADALGMRGTELRGVAEVALGEARRGARRAVLAARQRLLERVFNAARDLFAEAMSADTYRAALPTHLAEALNAVGDAPAVLRCPETLVPAVRAAVARKKHLTVQGDPRARPGVTVTTTDGAIEVDNTLEGRLERLRARLALEVLARLDPSL